jgi:hypothetical protein
VIDDAFDAGAPCVSISFHKMRDMLTVMDEGNGCPTKDFTNFAVPGSRSSTKRPLPASTGSGPRAPPTTRA